VRHLGVARGPPVDCGGEGGEKSGRAGGGGGRRGSLPKEMSQAPPVTSHRREKKNVAVAKSFDGAHRFVVVAVNLEQHHKFRAFLVL